MKRFLAYWRQVFGPSVAQQAERLATEALLMEREESVRDCIVTETWQVGPIIVHLVQDDGVQPGRMIQLDGGDWEKAWSVEADAGLKSMLREACYAIATMPKE